MSAAETILSQRDAARRSSGLGPAHCSPSRRTHLDLFSGIGGFALAAQRAGWQTIGFSEINDHANKVLKSHWPNVRNYGDIRNVRGVRADLITGGFPCQPFSTAGHMRGTKDDRHLWPEMLRVIAEARPAWVLGENVSGIIGMELDAILTDLEALGYTAGALTIPACAVGARHVRDRVWICANSQGVRRSEGQRHEHKDRMYLRAGICGGSAAGLEYDHNNPIPSELIRVVDGLPDRVDRLHGLGNSIVPQVAEKLLRWMLEIHEAQVMENDKHQRAPKGGAQ